MFKVLGKLKRIITSRIAVIVLLLLLQVGIIALFIIKLSHYFVAMYGVFMIISIMVFLYVINKNDNPSYKLAWAIPILMFPLFGGIFYILLGSHSINKILLKRITLVAGEKEKLLANRKDLEEELKKENFDAFRQSSYLKSAGFPIYENTETNYYSQGESTWEAMLAELKKAKKYIFMEYFIIEAGEMWDSILAVLEQKVKEGVEVRLIYDGFGCMLTLPDKYYKRMREKGIKCMEFNPIVPVVTILMNNRDHRKITVIDGKVGFMGGINLADEYINKRLKHGHWKDTALELHGDAVRSLVYMFLSMWRGITGVDEVCDEYMPPVDYIAPKSSGFVQPYSDSPIDEELVGEMTYLNMINRAGKYIYICTPYLIIDNESVTALTLAAKSGVDVRIITPHIGDKWYVHMVTRAYYPQLIAGGVKIYEYEPGFIHAKTFVSDDQIATVGTINLDYRSLYLHFECGVWMYGTSAISEMKEDFLKTQEKSIPIDMNSPIIKSKGIKKLVCAVLRVFAPLM